MRFCVIICNGGEIPPTIVYDCKPNLNCVAGNGKVESKGTRRMSERECRLSKLARQAEDDMTKTKVELMKASLPLSR